MCSPSPSVPRVPSLQPLQVSLQRGPRGGREQLGTRCHAFGATCQCLTTNLWCSVCSEASGRAAELRYPMPCVTQQLGAVPDQVAAVSPRCGKFGFSPTWTMAFGVPDGQSTSCVASPQEGKQVASVQLLLGLRELTSTPFRTL